MVLSQALKGTIDYMRRNPHYLVTFLYLGRPGRVRMLPQGKDDTFTL